METKINLPKDFLFGAASSAHQVEGNNTNSDWWHFEQEDKLPTSGLAADHYNRYEEDFKIAQGLGLNLMRISLEWSRIEPKDGQFDMVAVEHYRNVLKTLKFLGIKRMATLFHFTLPYWLAQQGGFESKNGVKKFARFAEFVAKHLGEEIDYFITINEAEIYSFMGWKSGMWPPFKKNQILMLKVLTNLIEAHKQAFNAIKRNSPSSKIGTAKNSTYAEALNKIKPMDRLVVWIFKKINNYYFFDKVKNYSDFLGLNYYYYDHIKFNPLKGYIKTEHNFDSEQGKNYKDTKSRSDLGWRIFPEGIYHLLIDLKKYNKPVFVTENGVADIQDKKRRQFIIEHLNFIAKAIADGANVKGYCYWSLTDTYEWRDGFGPKFGLVEINFQTQERRIRPSALVFREMAE